MSTWYFEHPQITNLFHYVTNVGVPPIVFGVGLAGNLLLMLVLNQSKMRGESAVYVYLAATSTVDLIALLCAVPKFICDLELLLLPVPWSQSFPAALAVSIRRAIEPMVRHSAAWFVALAVAVRVTVACCRRSAATTVDEDSDTTTRWRCTRISSACIMTFVVVVVNVLLDIISFFDESVVPLADHCFDPSLDVWSVNQTSLAVNRTSLAFVKPGYFKLQSVVVGSVVPITVAALFAAVLSISTSTCRRSDDDADGTKKRSSSVCLGKPADYDAREHQLTVTIIAVGVATVCLEGPRAAIDAADAYFGFMNASGGSFVVNAFEIGRYTVMVAHCLSLVRCSVNFFLIVLLNYDFRKVLRRTLCCCCQAPDDVYYEPVVCCRRGSSSDDFEETTPPASKQNEIIQQAETNNTLEAEHAAVPPERRDDRNGITGGPSGLQLDTVRSSSDDKPLVGTQRATYCDVDDEKAIWI